MVICISGDYENEKSELCTLLSSTTNFQYYSLREFIQLELTKHNNNPINLGKVVINVSFKQINEYILDKTRNDNCILNFNYAAIICYLNKIKYIGLWIASPVETTDDMNPIAYGKNERKIEEIMNNRKIFEDEESIKLFGLSYKDKRFYHFNFDLKNFQTHKKYIFTSSDEPNKLNGDMF